MANREAAIRNMLIGRSDHTLTFLQRAYFLQTGESVALLSGHATNDTGE